jgi:hypothetical protein
MIAANISDFRPELVDRFDLVVSWQVLEHVKPLSLALTNVRSYLRPGGLFVAMLSGTFSVFGIANKVTPAWFGPWVLQHMTGRDPESVFPAYYDGCHYDGLRRKFDGWSAVDVEPLFRGAAYFRRWPSVQRAYLGYENRIARAPHANLATHYLITARR